MIKIRRNVFETNSSSTHSLIICSQAEFDSFKQGNLFIDTYNDKLITKEEYEKEFLKFINKTKKEGIQPIEHLTSDLIQKYKEDFWTMEGIFNYDEYMNDYFDYYGGSGLESYEEHYTTKGGEKIVAFGSYGYPN